MEWTPDEIRAALDERDWTQRELAERLGVALRTVNAWAAGTARISRRNARELSKVFGGEPAPANPLHDLSHGALWAQIDALLAEAKRRYTAAVESPHSHAPPLGVTADIPPHVLARSVERNAIAGDTPDTTGKRTNQRD